MSQVNQVELTEKQQELVQTVARDVLILATRGYDFGDVVVAYREVYNALVRADAITQEPE